MVKFIKKIVKALRNSWATSRKTNFDNENRFLIFLDCFYCILKFHITPKEYLDYQFYNYKNCYRKNFLLIYHQQNEYKFINEKGFTRSKFNFYQRIPECFSREMILAPMCGEEKFLEFAKKHHQIVTKPDGGSYGRNIEFFTYHDDEQARSYFAALPDRTICEEYIWQHKQMNVMNPFSVNTIRIVSLLKQDEVHIISATLRTGGKPGVCVDNLKNNGVGAQVDIATGIVCTAGFDYNDKVYVRHPVSGTQFLGFNIPNWEMAIEVVKRAHKKLPQCKILGWDIAITRTGVDVVEANNAPGVPIMQIGDMTPKGEKVLEVIKEIKRRKH